jgi:hypothetical protein
MSRLGILALLVSCSHGSIPMTTSAAPSAPAASPSAPGSRPTGPTIDLGPTLSAIPFAPGRYATLIQKTSKGTHALQVFKEYSATVLLLELGADGDARACRGWRYSSYNDGPKVHTADKLREQQGYRGTYVLVDGVAEVELETDEAVCPSIHQFTYTPKRAARLKLRCALATPCAPGSLTGPILVCQPPRDAEELFPFRETGLVPEGWFPLGADNGLLVTITGAPQEMVGDPRNVQVERAAAPIGRDAWEQP